jgi:hypothetical protein
LHSKRRCGDHPDRFPYKLLMSTQKLLIEKRCAGASTAMSYSVIEAARLVGRSRATINRLIVRGTLSASRSGPGKPWAIDAAELSRVFPSAAHEMLTEQSNGQLRAGGEQEASSDHVALIAAKDQLIAQQQEALDDLRRRLDIATEQREHEAEERRAVQARLDALLTDQRAVPPAPARRSWWPWRRAQSSA